MDRWLNSKRILKLISTCFAIRQDLKQQSLQLATVSRVERGINVT